MSDEKNFISKDRDIVLRLREEAEGHQTVYHEDRRRKELFEEAASHIERMGGNKKHDTLLGGGTDLAGREVEYMGARWFITGRNYLGDWDVVRFEEGQDGRYKIGSSVSELQLPCDHPRYAVLIPADDKSEPDSSASACTLLEAARIGARWMKWWLSENECECEYGHTCGKTEREDELRQIEAAIQSNEETQATESKNPKYTGKYFAILNGYPSDEEDLHIQAYFHEGDPPFICGARGGLTQDVFVEIEQTMIDNPESFDRGNGDYLFIATRQIGQKTFPETGQWDFPPHWELELIHFRHNANMSTDKPPISDPAENFEVGKHAFQFRCEWAVYTKRGETSLCYTTTKDYAQLIAAALEHFQSTGKIDEYLAGAQKRSGGTQREK